MDETSQERPGRPPDPAAADPFWEPVRRRHPDVDLVLLPPVPPVDPGVSVAPQVPVDRADTEAAAHELLARLWSAATGDPAVVERHRRWFAGERQGTERLEETWSVEGVTPDDGLAAVRRVVDALESDGWRVLVPTAGVPRVQAGRADGLDRAEVLLLVSPERGRLVLRHRSGSRPAVTATPGEAGG